MNKVIVFSLLFCLAQISIAQNALNFDGSNDFVGTTYQGIIGSTNRTFEAWINVSASAPSSNLAILDYGANLAGSRNTFAVSGGRGLTFISGGTNANISSPAATVPVGQWVHVAFVLNNGTGFLYVDGVQVGTGNLSSVNTPFGNTNVRIGQRVPGGSILFNGDIDEVRMWNVARSAAELNANRNVEFCTNPTGLVAYYKMNEGVANGNNSSVLVTVDEVSGNNGALGTFALNGTTSNFVTGVNLTNAFASSQTLSGCQGFTVSVGGNTYDSTGIYVDTLAAVLTGCDSVVTTDLTVTGIDSVTQTLNECPGFSVAVDSNVYNATGVYVDTLTSVLSGCDSIVTTALTIDTLDISTTVSGITVMATQSGVTYAWIDCDNGNALIPGETSQSFSPALNGNYAVILDNGVCTDTSACVNMIVVGVDIEKTNAVTMYPNPANDKIFIHWGNMDHFSIAIVNSVGQQVLHSSAEGDTQQVDVSNFPSGIYFLEIEKDGEKARRKFIKL